MRHLLFTLLLSFFFGISFNSNAQFKNLGKKLKKKVEDRVDQKVDRTADKGLDEVEEGIEETVTGDGNNNDESDPEANKVPNSNDNPSNDNPVTTNNQDHEGSVNGDFQVNTKFDYVPGEALMIYDDFSQDAIGDFPVRWNTDGTGEVVSFGTSDDKWFLMKSGSDYIPDLPRALPEEYTIEFDLAARGIDKHTASTTVLEVILDDNNLFKQGKNFAMVRIPFCQYHHIGFYVRNSVNHTAVVNNQVDADIRNQVMNQPHISIAVNNTRFRLWVNEKKYIDVPRLIPPGGIIQYLKFKPYYFKDGKEDIFIRNLKIAEGGLDLRSKLLKEGTVSTNGILFDVNSANLKPESYGVIRQIALAMEESDMRLTIIGHTDSDGGDDDNLKLSQQRAMAVKDALINDFDIAANRLEIQGKGESQPVAENSSPEGKAANRRVEFVSL